jgi:formate/nitrite transporter FocA (FNT family)
VEGRDNEVKENGRIFLKAAAAGITIGIGGAVYLTLENRVIGAVLFGVGLYTIVLNGLFLYTGKVGYLISAKDKKAYILQLIFTWLGNFAGTALAAAAISATRIRNLRRTAEVICKTKLADTPHSILILAVFCGILMYVAVDGFREKGNPLILFFCVTVFILCGFEHCIANMFYFSLAGAWSLRAVIYLLLMTLGNSVGGILLPLVKKV